MSQEQAKTIENTRKRYVRKPYTPRYGKVPPASLLFAFVMYLAVGLSEVIQAINAASGIVEHHEDCAGAVFRPREQGEVVGAEVEHR